MKNLLIIFLFFSWPVFGGIKKDFIVTKLAFDDEKKLYLVHFENQAGVYKAEEKFFVCLSESLKSNRPARIEFNPMGLGLIACQKVATK